MRAAALAPAPARGRALALTCFVVRCRATAGDALAPNTRLEGVAGEGRSSSGLGLTSSGHAQTLRRPRVISRSSLVHPPRRKPGRRPMAPRKKVCASPSVACRGCSRGCQHGWLTPRPRPGASGRPQGWHGTADAPGRWRVGTGRRAACEGAALRGIAIGKEPCSVCLVLRTQEEEKEPPHFWFPYPGDGYALGEVLHHDQDTDNMNVRLKLEAGPKVRTRQPGL